MRLIDANTLKKALDEQMRFEENCRDSVFDIIDNVPTIIWCSENSDGLPLMDLRPRQKGEWIAKTTYDGLSYWICNQCQRPCYDEGYYFCPICGADMRGEQWIM